MADTFSRDRLQPALLDRLLDDAPTERAEAPEVRAINRQRLRQGVLRDLNWLFNAVSLFGDAPTDDADARVRGSTLNYGFPSMAGTLASKVDLYDMEQLIRRTILDFEPRILPDSLRVRGVPHPDGIARCGVLEFEIAGRLWAQPYPVELLLRTALNLESGQVDVEEGAVPVRAGGVRGR
jgi:type VI secretion system protein ImpF